MCIFSTCFKQFSKVDPLSSIQHIDINININININIFSLLFNLMQIFI